MSAPRRLTGLAGWLARLRVHHWLHFLALPLASWDPKAHAALAHLVRAEATAFAVLGFGYLLNGVTDRRHDAPGKNPLTSEDEGAIRASTRASGLLALGALALGAVAPWPVPVAAAIAVGTGFVYSSGPRLKTVPLVGTLLNAAAFGPLLWLGTCPSGVPAHTAPLAVCFSGLLLQNQLLHEAADIEEDTRGAIHTTVRLVGLRGAALLAALAGTAPAVTFAHWGMTARAAVVAAVFGVGVPLAMLRRGGDPRGVATVRAAQRWLSLAVGALAIGSAALR
jgi:4-hydroxybenzoate polyprenyltransferase